MQCIEPTGGKIDQIAFQPLFGCQLLCSSLVIIYLQEGYQTMVGYAIFDFKNTKKQIKNSSYESVGGLDAFVPLVPLRTKAATLRTASCQPHPRSARDPYPTKGVRCQSSACLQGRQKATGSKKVVASAVCYLGSGGWWIYQRRVNQIDVS